MGLIVGVALSSLLLAADWPGRALALRQEYGTADTDRRLQIVLDLPEAASPARDELLRRGLDDEDPRVQRAALRTATRVRAVGLADAVAASLEGGIPARRALAAEALGALGDPRVAPALTRALGDTDPTVRTAAVVALGRLGGTEADVVLFDRTNDPETPVRLAAVRVLGTLGDPRSVFALLGALQDPVPEVRVAAVRALGALRDPRAVRGIVGLLHDPTPEVASAAVAALAALGPEARDAAEALSPIALRTSRDGDPRTRGPLAREALAALGRVGGPVARDTLLQALHRTADPNEARTAAAALESLGPDARAGLLRLFPQLSDPRRLDVIPVLGRLGGDDAARTLVTWLDGAPALPFHRDAALRALGDTRSDVALHHLLRALPASLCAEPPPRPDGPIAAALAALLALSERPEALPSLAIDPLAEALARCDGAHTPHRAALATLLGRTGDPRAAAILGPLLDDPAAPVRAVGVQALAALPGPASPLLLRALGDHDPTVRAHSLQGLARHADPDTARALGARLRDPAPLDRAGTARALGQMAAALGPTHPEAARTAVDTLLSLVEGSGPGLRSALLDALAEHGDHPGASGFLVRSLRDPDRGVVMAAVEAAGHALAASPDTLEPPLAQHLLALRQGPSARDPALRGALSWALGHHLITRRHVADDLSDPRPEVAGPAAGALSLGPLPEGSPEDPIRAALCTRASGVSPLVRVNAAHALAAQGWTCEGIDPAAWLLRERSALLRIAAARWVHRLGGGSERAVRALARCAASDPSPAVAAACQTRPAEPPAPRTRVDLRVEGPEGAPGRGTAVVLVRPEGLLRWAVGGPDGWIHERPVAPGRFSVAAPDELTADQ